MEILACGLQAETLKSRAYSVMSKNGNTALNMYTGPAVLVTDGQGQITYFNSVSEELLAIDGRDLSLKSAAEIFPPGEWQKICAGISSGNLVIGPFDTSVIRGNKDLSPVKLTVNALSGQLPAESGLLIMLHDLSESKSEYRVEESIELSRGLIETAATAIFLLKEGKFTFANAVLEEISGYTADELRKIDRLDIIYADQREEARISFEQALNGDQTPPAVLRILRKDMEIAWVSERLTRVEYKGRQLVMGNWMDITEWKIVEEISNYHTRQTELLLKIGSTVGQTLNLKNIVENFLDSLSGMLNDRPAAFFLLPAGSQELEMISQRGFSEEFVRRMSRIKVGKGFIGRVALTGLSFVLNPTYYDPRFDPAILEKDNLWSICSVPVFARDQIRGVICVGSRTQRQSLEEDAQLFELIASQIGIAIDNALLYEKTVEMAFTDGLTGLYNRRYLLEEFEREISRASRDRSTVSCISMDINNLKIMNDRFGHNQGDCLIKAFAEVIRKVCRKTDIAARMGGDEFVLLSPDCDQIGPVSRRIIGETNCTVLQIKGQPFKLSVSLGSASFPLDGTTAEEVLAKADKAMYAAKKALKEGKAAGDL